jgi:hypothetical protein
MPDATTTTNHDEIRRWAEARGGRPAIIRTGQASGGVLRFDFGNDDARLAEVSWEEFFRLFDENRLALLRQEETVSGQQSRFFKFVDRNTSSGLNHDAEMQGETAMNSDRDETAHAPESEMESDKGTGRRQDTGQDRRGAGMDEMEDGMAEDRMNEEQRPPRRAAARRPATKRSSTSSKRTSTRSSSSRASSGSAKRGSPARKSGSRKTASASRSLSRSGARKTASRKAPAKKSAAKRTSGSRRGSASSSSRGRSAKRAPAKRSR